MQFKEHFVRRGVDGGRKAAQALKAAILKQCHGVDTEIEVIAKVCLNLAGLAKAMRADGSLDSESQLKDFTLGFTQAIASFDVIDIGGGRSDVKLEGTEARDSIHRRYSSRMLTCTLQRRLHGTLETTTANT